jgi:hypothetical protein
MTRFEIGHLWQRFCFQTASFSLSRLLWRQAELNHAPRHICRAPPHRLAKIFWNIKLNHLCHNQSPPFHCPISSSVVANPFGSKKSQREHHNACRGCPPGAPSGARLRTLNHAKLPKGDRFGRPDCTTVNKRRDDSPANHLAASPPGGKRRCA